MYPKHLETITNSYCVCAHLANKVNCDYDFSTFLSCLLKVDIITRYKYTVNPNMI